MHSSQPDQSDLHQYLRDAEREYFVRSYRGSIWLGVAVILAFTIVDYALAPDHPFAVLPVRLLAIPIGLASWLAYRSRTVCERFHLWPAFACSVYMGVLMSVLTAHTGYEASVHFVALLLTLFNIVARVPWRPGQLPWVMLVVGGPYWAQMAGRFSVGNRGLMLASAMFFLTTVLLVLSVYRSLRSARLKELVDRFRLEHRNRLQKAVIDQKTREGIYLERLASQFSPQVIESIKSGTLDLDERSRREVACIFVDVQGSTARASRIDHRNYTELMAAFFQECVKVFLRHNVTVGTYLGDGILAFTNAPTEDPEYRRNALAACLEILELHARKRKVYFDAWRTDFNIRIGIDAGYATVGFFPSREHGTYTALGETVSLAARLCSRSETNALAVTKRFLTSVSLPEGSLRIERLTTASDIKGLEGEMFEVFCVRPPSVAEVPATDCPSCLVPMERESAQVGAVYYRCPKCQYRNLIAEPTPGLRRVA